METLNDLPAFKTSPKLVEELKSFSIQKHFEVGQIILNVDAFIRSIPIVLEGLLKVMRTEEDGREILLYYLKSGESCIMSFLGGLHNERSMVRVEVEESAEILFVPISKVGWLLREYPQWMDYVFRLYHKRFEELLETVNAIAFKRVDERLLALIQKKVQLTASQTISVTHEQLARELGTSRVVVSRLLKRLEEQNQVILGRNKITVTQNSSDSLSE